LKDDITKTRNLVTQQDMDQCLQFINDLQLLTSGRNIDASLISKLSSPLYKEQSFRFAHHKAEQEALLKKANKEEEINSYLAKEKIISPKEFLIFKYNRKE